MYVFLDVHIGRRGRTNVQAQDKALASEGRSIHLYTYICIDRYRRELEVILWAFEWLIKNGNFLVDMWEPFVKNQQGILSTHGQCEK